MDSMLVRTDDIGFSSRSRVHESLSAECKRHVQRFISQWQSSSISMLFYSLVIASVAIYDITLTIKYANSLAQLEVNPIGRWLMNIETSEIQLLRAPTGMYLFLKLKALGTALVIGILYALVRWRMDMGHAVAFGVTMFQTWLFIYLTTR